MKKTPKTPKPKLIPVPPAAPTRSLAPTFAAAKAALGDAHLAPLFLQNGMVLLVDEDAGLHAHEPGPFDGRYSVNIRASEMAGEVILGPVVLAHCSLLESDT